MRRHVLGIACIFVGCDIVGIAWRRLVFGAYQVSWPALLRCSRCGRSWDLRLPDDAPHTIAVAVVNHGARA